MEILQTVQYFMLRQVFFTKMHLFVFFITVLFVLMNFKNTFLLQIVQPKCITLYLSDQTGYIDFKSYWLLKVTWITNKIVKLRHWYFLKQNYPKTSLKLKNLINCLTGLRNDLVYLSFYLPKKLLFQHKKMILVVEEITESWLKTLINKSH